MSTHYLIIHIHGSVDNAATELSTTIKSLHRLIERNEKPFWLVDRWVRAHNVNPVYVHTGQGVCFWEVAKSSH